MKEYIPLGDVITKASVERCGDRDLPILSITMKDGLIMQDEKFKKRIASVDTTDYKVIPRGLLVQGIHIDEANFGIQDIVDAGIVSPAYKVWKVKENSIYPKYLETIMRSPRSLAYYKSKLNGSVNRRGRMSDDEFLNMPIPYVDISEQKRIIGILNQSKSIITDKNRLLDSLDTLIKARFVEMFGDESQFVSAPLDNSVEEMFIGPFGSSLKNECFVPAEDGFCMVYEQKHAIRKTMDVDTRYVDEKKYHELQRFTVLGGDIIVSCRGTIGETFIVPNDAPIGIMHPSIMKIRLKSTTYNRVFFNHLLQTVLKRHEDEANGSGVKMAITATALGQESFIIPSMTLQNQFASFVYQVDKSKAVVQQALAKDQLLFDSLMQQYFG